MIRGGGVATESMPLAHEDPSEEARRHQQASHASRTNDAPARYSYTNSGWPREFTKGQEIPAHVLFNQSHIGTIRRAWEAARIIPDSRDGQDDDDDCDEVEDPIESEEEDDQDDDGIVDESKEETSVAKVFMRSNLHVVDSDRAGPWPKGTELIERKYGHIRFEDLPRLEPKAKPVAFIEENSRGGVYLKTRGPLNPLKLRAVLQQLRYAKRPGEASWKRPDVDQRRMCIFDPSPEAIAVLMETSSSIDAAVLPELLYLHLNRKPSAGVSISSSNVKTFTFRLSLPFYARATQNIPPKYGSSRQQTLSIPDVGEFIVGHTTIFLAGVDEERWTATALVDGSIGYAATVDVDEPPTRGLRKDPITGTYIFSPDIGHNARLYFPWLWKAWIDKVRDQWADVIGLIADCIQEKDRKDAFLVKSEHADVIKDLMSSIATSAQWDYLLTPMQTELAGIVGAWQKFEKCGKKYFQDISTLSGDILATRDSFPGIEDTYVELEELLQQLGDLLASLRRPQLNNVRDARMRDQGLRDRRLDAQTQKEITQNSAKDQKRAAARAVRSHEEVARSAWKATVTTMALLPFMLAFTLFSMEASAIPFQASFRMLLCSLAVFTLVMVFLFNVLDVVLGILAVFLRACLNFLIPRAKVPERELENMDDTDDSDWEYIR